MIEEWKMNFSQFVVSQYVFKMDSIYYEGKYMDRSSSKEKRNRARLSVIVL